MRLFNSTQNWPLGTYKPNGVMVQGVDSEIDRGYRLMASIMKMVALLRGSEAFVARCLEL